jgi:hypothetical protein
MMIIEEGNCLLPGVLEEEVLLLPGGFRGREGEAYGKGASYFASGGENSGKGMEWVTA